MMMDAWNRENYERNISETPICNICNNGKNKINSISTMNISSKWATFDLGMLNEVNFCPKCGKRLLR